MKPFEVRKTSKGLAVYNGSTNERESGFYSSADLVQTRCDRLNREMKAAARTAKRKCMCCRAEFQSQGIHNRLCKNCGAHGQDKQMVEPCTQPR